MRKEGGEEVGIGSEEGGEGIQVACVQKEEGMERECAVQGVRWMSEKGRVKEG